MVILVVALIPITASDLHASIAGQASLEPRALPVAAGQWAGPSEAEIDWAPVYIGEYNNDFGQYSNEFAMVDIYAITYGYQTQGSELINSENSIFDSNRWTRVRENAATIELPSGQRWDYMELELLAGDRKRKRLIRYWYTVNDNPANSQIQIKLAELKNAVQGRPSSSSVIAISTEFLDDADAAGAILDDFYTTLLADSPNQTD
jgi:EpsI family protein